VNGKRPRKRIGRRWRQRSDAQLDALQPTPMPCVSSLLLCPSRIGAAERQAARPLGTQPTVSASSFSNQSIRRPFVSGPNQAPRSLAQLVQQRLRTAHGSVVRAVERSPVALSAGIILLVAVGLLVLDILFRPSPLDILVEAHGILFDLVVFGVVVLAVDQWRRKRERTARWLEELHDIRRWREPEAAFRIAGLLKRLQQHGISIAMDLSEVFLADANLSGLDCGDLTFARGNLERCDLSRARMFQTDLRGANLRNSSFVGADLNQVRFDGADLSEADFRQSSILSARFVNASLENADLTDHNLNGIAFTGANLSGANLQRSALNDCGGSINFSRADLRFSHFGRLNLAGGSLQGVVLEWAWIYDIEDITGWTEIGSIRHANVNEARNWTIPKRGLFAPEPSQRTLGAAANVQQFYEWALANGAVDMPWKEWKALCSASGVPPSA